MVVFFSQILSLMIFIMLSKLFVWAKEKTLSYNELEILIERDPFYGLLLNTSNDFLVSDNMIMIINTL